MTKLPRLAVHIVLTVILCTIYSKPCFAFDDGDFHWWTSAGASFDINKDWKCTFEEEFRLGDDAGELYYHHSDLGFVYGSFADWIDLGFNYRLVFGRAGSAGDWKQENRPHLNITLKGKLFDLNVSNRSRFEFRDIEDYEDHWRYRNKFTVKLPLELTDLKLKPYVADEVFIPLNDDNVSQNRVYAGFSFDVLENMKGEIFYCWLSARVTGDWRDYHVLGTRLKFQF